MNTGVVLKEIGGVGEGMLKRSIRKLSLSTMLVPLRHLYAKQKPLLVSSPDSDYGSQIEIELGSSVKQASPVSLLWGSRTTHPDEEKPS